MAEYSLKDIITVIKNSHKQLKTRELAKKMKVKQNDYKYFRHVVKEAIANGKLAKGRGGKLTIPKHDDFIVGKLFVSHAGHGFVIPENETEDIYIAQRDLGGAIHGEKVKVVLKPVWSGKNREGKIVEVIDRQSGRVVGKIKMSRYGVKLQSSDPRIRDAVELQNPQNLPIKKNMIVTARLKPWKASYLPLEGTIEEILGMEGTPGVDIDSLIIAHGLPREFDERVKPELNAIRKAVTKPSLANRLDLRELITFTIDPADAKDHDDAVSIEKLANANYRLGVHIADVSHFVNPSTALDSEAKLRGNSVYLVDRVIPMLPEKLSADICSLHDNEDRLTLSFIAELDKNGNVINWEFAESVIRSRASLSYEQAQDYLNGNYKGREIDKKAGRTLKDLLQISKAVRAERMKRGSLDFDLPEPKVVLDSRGKVLDIFSPKRLETHEIIEEFMLLANKYAAKYLGGEGLPLLYRVHAKPDKEKIDNFAELLKEMGYNFSFKGEMTPIKIQRVINLVKGKPEEQFIEEILLRSLSKAAYQPKNIGHFGLAFDTYCHFTSPIRRYPDLLIHRLLKLLIRKKVNPVVINEIASNLKRVGEHCTQTEIAADRAERESLKIKKLEYLSERVGGIFDGLVSGVVKTGMFVEIIGSMIEGFVSFADIADDYFVLDEGKFRAVGKRTNRVFKLGDKVQIIVDKVRLEERKADFVLVSQKPISKKKSGGKGKRRR
jgi:ribonuclease R